MELSLWRDWWRRVGERELRVVTMEVWDPIGVSGDPDFAGEYDAYLGQIAARLRDGDSAEELARFLSRVAAEEMGCEQPSADLEAARRMRAWYAESTARFASEYGNAA